MLLPLSEAAKLAGISKSALYKAVKRGKVSAVRDDIRDDVLGEWRIDSSELARVYPIVSTSAQTEDTTPSGYSQSRISGEDFLAERQHYEQRIASLESERDFLRQALQTESEERRQITRLLTQAQPIAESVQPSPRTPWVLYVIGLAAVIGAGVAVWYVVRMSQ